MDLLDSYKYAENVFHPDDAHKSVPEQIRGTKERLKKAGYLNEESSKKYEKLVKEAEELEGEAAGEVLLKLLTMQDDDVLYDDGDQTPLKGMESQKLRSQWCTGMGFHPQRLPPFHRACYDGNVEKVRRGLRLAKDKRKLMEKRESLMQFNALVCVVQGVRMLPDTANADKHVETLKVLIEAGGNVNTKDVAGYSVLFHCFTSFGNTKLKLQLAKVLINAGANVNAQNRFGCTPLHENIMTRNQPVIEMLIDNGGDPSIKDNDGISPHSMSNMLPASQRVFCMAGFLKSREKRAEEKKKGSFACHQCGSNNAKKRCTRCLVAFYCNRECQVDHWKLHKNDCKQKQKGLCDVELTNDYATTINLQTNQVTSTKPVEESTTKPAKSHFKVKVQVPLMSPAIKQDLPLLVYDKQRSFQRRIESSDPSYAKIVKKIQDEGVMKVKGYFWASFSESGKLTIQVDNIIPPEMW